MERAWGTPEHESPEVPWGSAALGEGTVAAEQMWSPSRAPQMEGKTMRPEKEMLWSPVAPLSQPGDSYLQKAFVQGILRKAFEGSI